MSRLRVLVADDDPLIREALRDVLTAQPDLDVVAVAKDTDETIALTELHAPAVVVLDVRMPGGGGARAAREIGPRSPRTRILVFSAYADPAVIAEMKALGVTDYLLKGVTNAELVAAVRSVAGC
ncbi:MAG: response regulator transcription factor [Kibdelosporangium sp.]